MKPKEIAELVYAVGGPGLSHPTDCCVYLVDAGKELVLIDAGAGPGAEAILRNVEALGFDPTGIGHLVATHCHIDHIGDIPDQRGDGLHAYGSSARPRRDRARRSEAHRR